MTDQAAPAHTNKVKDKLLSRTTWLVIVALSLLSAFSNPVPGQKLSYIAGKFTGSFVLYGGVWALIVVVWRWASRRFRKNA